MAAEPDLSYDELRAALADNNIGAITEEDVRSIVEFSRVHAITVANDNFDLVIGSTSQSSWMTTGDSPDYTYAAFLMNNGLGESSEAYVDGASEPLWVSASSNGITYSSSAEQDRLFSLKFRFTGYPASEFYGQVGFYILEDGETWPDNVFRARNIYIQRTGVGHIEGTPATPIYRYEAAGDTILQLKPGDTLVPLIEINQSTTPASLESLSYEISVASLGVVDGEFSNVTEVNGDGEQDPAFVLEASTNADTSFRNTGIPE